MSVVRWNWCFLPECRNKSVNVSVCGRLWGFLNFILRGCRSILLPDAHYFCVYVVMGFLAAVAHALHVCSWNQWGNEKTSPVDRGGKAVLRALRNPSSSAGRFICVLCSFDQVWS